MRINIFFISRAIFFHHLVIVFRKIANITNRGIAR